MDMKSSHTDVIDQVREQINALARRQIELKRELEKVQADLQKKLWWLEMIYKETND